MISKEDIEYYFYSIIDNKLLLASIAGFIVILSVMAIPAYAVLTTPNPTPTPIIKPTVTPTIKPTITTTPQVTLQPTIAATIEVTPGPTVRPTQDITSMKRFVVITTSTPVPVIRDVNVSASINNPIQLNDKATANVYIKTNDEPLHDVLIRFNVSFFNKDHEWQGLGYIPLDSGKVLSLPAHSQTTRPIGPFTIKREGIILPDGTMFNFHIWATVYKFKIDLISKEDSKIVGSTELNNVQVVKVDSYGLRSFDW